MICIIFRPKRTKNGNAQVSRLYRGRYRLEGDNKLNDVPLHTSDKRVSSTSGQGNRGNGEAWNL
jgi:hypothetical protein